MNENLVFGLDNESSDIYEWQMTWMFFLIKLSSGGTGGASHSSGSFLIQIGLAACYGTAGLDQSILFLFCFNGADQLHSHIEQFWSRFQLVYKEFGNSRI